MQALTYVNQSKQCLLSQPSRHDGVICGLPQAVPRVILVAASGARNAGFKGPCLSSRCGPFPRRPDPQTYTS